MMMIFRGDRLLLRDGGVYSPSVPPELQPLVIGNSVGLPEIWQELPPWSEVNDAADSAAVLDAFEWADLREVWRRCGDETFARAGTVFQYMNWLRSTRFCSRCAAPMSPRAEDRGLACSGCDCGNIVYAPLHPAVIVAVERDGKLLLAHNARMPAKRYSVLAGFVEPGESLEHTIEREIMEEAGIGVEEVRYFGSQSWPFPCSLMLGFTARWKSGELRTDGVELDDAGWFAPEEFPDIPPSLSISRKLIDDFARRHSRK